MAHDILEVPQIPNDARELRALIADMQRQRRKSKIIRWFCTLLVAIGILVPGSRVAVSKYHTYDTKDTHSIYLPIILR